MLIVNSFPKSGTNLVQALLEPVFKNAGHFGMFNGQTGEKYSDVVIGQYLVDLGSDRHKPAFVTSHLHWSPHFQDAVGGMPMILLLRDPRDVIVSHAHYVSGTPSHSLYKNYFNMSHEQKIWSSMFGILGTTLPDIATRLLPYIGWVGKDNVKVMFFENVIKDLAGAVEEIIWHYARLTFTETAITKMVDNANQGSSTFRKGTTGQWKEEFTDKQKAYYHTHFQWINKIIGGRPHEWD